MEASGTRPERKWGGGRVKEKKKSFVLFAFLGLIRSLTLAILIKARKKTAVAPLLATDVLYNPHIFKYAPRPCQ